MFGITLFESRMMQHEQFGLFDASWLCRTEIAIDVARRAEGVAVRFGRKIGCGARRKPMFHRVETRALRFFLGGMPFQVGRRCRFPFFRTRASGVRPGLHQPFFPSHLVAFLTAMRALAMIGEGVMPQIGGVINTGGLCLERAVARQAVKSDLGKGLGTVYRHGAQYCVSRQARNREDYGE